MSKFADNTKLYHRARNPDDIMELQEDFNKLVELANKWQISFIVDKCSVMHIGHNNMQSNCNMSLSRVTSRARVCKHLFPPCVLLRTYYSLDA